MEGNGISIDLLRRIILNINLRSKYMSINKRGFWEGNEAESQHCNDIPLGKSLVSFFIITSHWINIYKLVIHY